MVSVVGVGSVCVCVCVCVCACVHTHSSHQVHSVSPVQGWVGQQLSCAHLPPSFLRQLLGIITDKCEVEQGVKEPARDTHTDSHSLARSEILSCTGNTRANHYSCLCTSDTDIKC